MASGTQEVRFELFEPDARQAFVCGSFNQWSSRAMPMVRQADGSWTAAVKLPPGRYEYKFFVDGHWLPDLQAQVNVFNQFGTLNSVVDVPG